MFELPAIEDKDLRGYYETIRKCYRVVCASGYFNPLTVGHIAYLKEAAKLGDFLVVIVNSDEQVKLKGSVPFMKENERGFIVENLSFVKDVFIADDTDLSVCSALELIRPHIFANGGDVKTCREADICEELGIQMVFGVGGDKVQSSSTLIRDAAERMQSKGLLG